MNLKVIHEDDTLLVVEKPAGMTVWKEPARIATPAAKTAVRLSGWQSVAGGGPGEGKTVGDAIAEQFPAQKVLREEQRYGILHRLDKDTSGILLVAKTPEAFSFFQKQFQDRAVQKQYLCLVEGSVKEDKGRIETLLGRSLSDKRKQKAYLPGEPGSAGKREAITEYRVQERYLGYTLLEMSPKTGRKHQLRVQLASLGHPIAGDRLYGFKNQKVLPGLQRHFLHASLLKVSYPDGTVQEFTSELPEDLKNILDNLK
ncbi:MAG: RluA family pseudouridine synthase [Candidatus Wildermuthbacteria bacterium]|nr:RluA family pseudouridine synthase [Candidatus Wildermuthbacteria bacterium]